MKKYIAVAWLTILTTIIFGFFWFNQLVYSMPTPIPATYKEVKPGQAIPLGKAINLPGDKPIFLHFFNPDCPCSRFNIPHFKTLVKENKDKMNFAVVIMTNKPYTATEIQERFGLQVPVINNRDLATSCGVYSTPQAVVLNSDRQLYYRGNYNKSRYCTDEKTSYAKIAIESILQGNHKLQLDQYALKAYGCTLPNCAN